MNKNILIVDDDPSILDGFRELLTSERYWVDIAPDEEEAYAFMRNRHYHVILMDVVLKKTTGIDLMRKIKTLSRGTVVIMVTGYPTTESAIRSFREGAFDYLVKPVSKQVLLDVLRRSLFFNKEQQQSVSLQRIKEALEQANAEKDQILQKLSRDVIACSENIIRDNAQKMKGSLPASLAHRVQAINTNALYLKNLGENIQDAVRMGSGDFQLEENELDLAAVIEGVLRGLYPFVKDRPIQICYRLEKDVPSRLIGDERRLRQLLTTLFVNAVSTTLEGEVVLSVRLIAVLDRGCHLFFTLKDNAEKIPVHRQMEIFRPFAKKDGPPDAGEASCIDLWISKILVEKMGGLISLHSASNRGNEFRFSVRFALRN